MEQIKACASCGKKIALDSISGFCDYCKQHGSYQVGKELDILIAKEVMMFRKDPKSDFWYLNKIGEGTVLGPLPNYSKNSDDAWEIVKKIFTLNPVVQIEFEKHYKMPEAMVVNGHKKLLPSGQVNPFEVCLAALQAIRREFAK